jgi:hypothetical protein
MEYLFMLGFVIGGLLCTETSVAKRLAGRVLDSARRASIVALSSAQPDEPAKKV